MFVHSLNIDTKKYNSSSFSSHGEILFYNVAKDMIIPNLYHDKIVDGVNKNCCNFDDLTKNFDLCDFGGFKHPIMQKVKNICFGDISNDKYDSVINVLSDVVFSDLYLKMHVISKLDSSEIIELFSNIDAPRLIYLSKKYVSDIENMIDKFDYMQEQDRINFLIYRFILCVKDDDICVFIDLFKRGIFCLPKDEIFQFLFDILMTTEITKEIIDLAKICMYIHIKGFDIFFDSISLNTSFHAQYSNRIISIDLNTSKASNVASIYRDQIVVTDAENRVVFNVTSKNLRYWDEDIKRILKTRNLESSSDISVIVDNFIFVISPVLNLLLDHDIKPMLFEKRLNTFEDEYKIAYGTFAKEYMSSDSIVAHGEWNDKYLTKPVGGSFALPKKTSNNITYEMNLTDFLKENHHVICISSFKIIEKYTNGYVGVRYNFRNIIITKDEQTKVYDNVNVFGSEKVYQKFRFYDEMLKAIKRNYEIKKRFDSEYIRDVKSFDTDSLNLDLLNILLKDYCYKNCKLDSEIPSSVCSLVNKLISFVGELFVKKFQKDSKNGLNKIVEQAIKDFRFDENVINYILVYICSLGVGLIDLRNKKFHGNIKNDEKVIQSLAILLRDMKGNFYVPKESSIKSFLSLLPKGLEFFLNIKKIIDNKNKTNNLMMDFVDKIFGEINDFCIADDAVNLIKNFLLLINRIIDSANAKDENGKIKYSKIDDFIKSILCKKEFSGSSFDGAYVNFIKSILSIIREFYNLIYNNKDKIAKLFIELIDMNVENGKIDDALETLRIKTLFKYVTTDRILETVKDLTEYRNGYCKVIKKLIELASKGQDNFTSSDCTGIIGSTVGLIPLVTKYGLLYKLGKFPKGLTAMDQTKKIDDLFYAMFPEETDDEYKKIYDSYVDEHRYLHALKKSEDLVNSGDSECENNDDNGNCNKSSIVGIRNEFKDLVNSDDSECENNNDNGNCNKSSTVGIRNKSLNTFGLKNAKILNGDLIAADGYVIFVDFINYMIMIFCIWFFIDFDFVYASYEVKLDRSYELNEVELCESHDKARINELSSDVQWDNVKSNNERDVSVENLNNIQSNNEDDIKDRVENSINIITD